MHTLRKVPLFTAIALLVYMPFHIFLSQSLSLAIGTLDGWKAAKDVVLFGALGLTLLLFFWDGLQKKNRQYLIFLGLSALYGAVHVLTWLINRDEISTSGAVIGTVYNNRLLEFALLSWGAVLVFPGKIAINTIAKIVIGVSTVVCILGILQYLLPKDLLTHVGYSIERGVKPNFFIDDKPDLPRIMSSLRDPNSLGAYLILPITILSLAWAKRPKTRMLLSGLLLLHVWALFLTFSRSAWLGAMLSVGLALFWTYRKQVVGFTKKRWPFIVAALVALVVGVFLLRDQYVVQNVVFHSDENTMQTDSNNLHVDYAKQGVEGIADDPEGHGPGTAGLVSIRTKKEVVLTENYFIQIGYEVGVIGLIIFLGAIVFILRQLMRIKSNLSTALIASFAGITLCSLLLLTWSNEAVAATWWLMAGVVIAANQGSLGGGNGPKARRSRKS